LGAIRATDPEPGRNRAVGRPIEGQHLQADHPRRGGEALRVSEETYRDLYDNAPDMFCSVEAASGRIVQCNRALTEKTGYSRTEIIGRHIFEMYHPDCLEAVKRARESFQRTGEGRDLEFQLKCKDGSRIDVSLNVSAVRDEKGRILHSRSVWRDITRRKRVEEELRSSEAALRESQQELHRLAGRLLEAQEDERRRLARELHDDVTQRLAMLAVEAGRVERQLEPSAGAALDSLRQMKNRLVELSTDVHDLSRRLHPSILDDLGLATAIEWECASLGRRAGLEIVYRNRDVPADLPEEIGLCIYRIAQEGLRNIEKHANAAEARVVLEGDGEDVVLLVEDAGVGFDPERIRGAGGLGLASMGERARLVRARLQIRSKPGRGTRIEVRVSANGRR
jgi:PAS domain S-box-containing protein